MRMTLDPFPPTYVHSILLWRAVLEDVRDAMSGFVDPGSHQVHCQRPHEQVEKGPDDVDVAHDRLPWG